MMQNYFFLAVDDDCKIFFFAFFRDLTLVWLLELNFANVFFSEVEVVTAKQRYFESILIVLAHHFLKT